MGTGLKLYGKKDFNPQDGFYTVTKWVTVLMFPIVPIASYRAKRVSSEFQNYVVAFQSSTNYQMIKIPLDLRQVTSVYLGIYGSIVLFILLLSWFPDYAAYTAAVFGVLLLWWVIKIFADDRRVNKQPKENPNLITR